MPSIEENRAQWGSAYDWPEDGNEWSRPWGGPEMQWYWMIQPRIRRYLPARRVLEIAPGHGRWTQFLIQNAERLSAVDVSESCVQVCREKFYAFPNVSFSKNDGQSLSCVEDKEVDLVFSFDSLVHAEVDTLEGYVSEIARKLSTDGVAFLHHSNLGAYPLQITLANIPKLRAGLRILGLLEKRFHWRAKSMTAEKMVDITIRHGLLCISQELVNWGTRRALIDCFSTLVRPDSKWARECRANRNPHFMYEAERIRCLSTLYGGNG